MQLKNTLKHLKIFETLNKELPSSLFIAFVHSNFQFMIFGGTWGGNRRKTSAFEWLFMAGTQRLPDGSKITARMLHRIRVVRVQTHESDDNMTLGGVLLMEEESGEENRNGLMLSSISIKNSWEKRVWSIKISRQRRKCRRVGWMWPWGWLT